MSLDLVHFETLSCILYLADNARPAGRPANNFATTAAAAVVFSRSKPHTAASERGTEREGGRERRAEIYIAAPNDVHPSVRNRHRMPQVSLEPALALSLPIHLEVKATLSYHAWLREGDRARSERKKLLWGPKEAKIDWEFVPS